MAQSTAHAQPSDDEIAELAELLRARVGNALTTKQVKATVRKLLAPAASAPVGATIH